MKIWLHTLLIFSCRYRDTNHYIKLLIIVSVTKRTGSIDLHHCVGGSHSGPNKEQKEFEFKMQWLHVRYFNFSHGDHIIFLTCTGKDDEDANHVLGRHFFI
jgi:hypothetical protein